MEVERNLISLYEMTDLNSAMNPSQLYKTNWKDADYSTKVAMEKARIALVKQVKIKSLSCENYVTYIEKTATLNIIVKQWNNGNIVNQFVV